MACFNNFQKLLTFTDPLHKYKDRVSVSPCVIIIFLEFVLEYVHRVYCK